MPNPTAAMLVIGDEILSGRTRDVNLHHLAGKLTLHGIDLREARVVADVQADIVAALRDLSARYTHVFTSGGIGPTHDDITADAVAAAFEVPIGVRDDARAILEEFIAARGSEVTPARLRMARIPEGARLIENPVSAAPGFSLGNVHVMAGVPKIFEAMLDGLLATLEGGKPLLSQTLRVELPEGDIAGPLSDLAARHPGLSIGSYPYSHQGVFGANIVVRGQDGAEVSAAMVELGRLFPGATV
ncbi:competence/damage-inducible protein A [Sinisalibacter aestuarii]|uniref:Molybdenum cofactor biosynthesis protein n=1 Tax=Sinisalibacter aestuarii TaxID=2949426 RepID=A0ABQ5LUX2_9RHOB|nr:molybdopterin-binding protein [Sinisalibacter aestuarii]GKY88787.1 molybdenum cofactor biosynthesis protein [Sinisalibacter aestuarii]